MDGREVGLKVASKTWIEIPLKGGGVYDFTEDELSEYKNLYPNIDVELQIRRAVKWCENNPARKKTKKGVGRFLSHWLNNSRPTYNRSYRQYQGNVDYDAERGFLD